MKLSSSSARDSLIFAARIAADSFALSSSLACSTEPSAFSSIAMSLLRAQQHRDLVGRKAEAPSNTSHAGKLVYIAILNMLVQTL